MCLIAFMLTPESAQDWPPDLEIIGANGCKRIMIEPGLVSITSHGFRVIICYIAGVGAGYTQAVFGTECIADYC